MTVYSNYLERTLLTLSFGTMVLTFSSIAQTDSLSNAILNSCNKNVQNPTNVASNQFYPTEGIDTASFGTGSGAMFAILLHPFIYQAYQPPVSYYISDPESVPVYKIINTPTGGQAMVLKLVDDLIYQPDKTTKNFILKLKSPAKACTTMTVTNKKGIVVFERDLQEGQTQFTYNLDALGSGVFICNITHGFVNLYAQKLVISK
jgi:hypothetical protein